MENKRHTKNSELYKNGLRRCHICKEIKLLSLFYKHKGRSGGYDYACKKCKNEGVKRYRTDERYKKQEALRRKRYREKNKIKLTSLRYLKTYGITYEEKENLLFKQNYECKICNKKINMITGHIDHDHKTKTIRGILCSNCNTALGLFGDNKDIISKAINYF